LDIIRATTERKQEIVREEQRKMINHRILHWENYLTFSTGQESREVENSLGNIIVEFVEKLEGERVGL
jgi:hypothetical protein